MRIHVQNPADETLFAITPAQWAGAVARNPGIGRGLDVSFADDDAGFAAALGKPFVTLHPPEHDHALKEVDRAAMATARDPEQVVEILRYVLEGKLATA